MNTTEEKRFRPLYEKTQQCLVLQGLRPKTVEAYSLPFASICFQ